MSKITKAYQKPTKRRRPSKKLVTSLESLTDALPDSEEVDGEGITIGDAKIRHKSLKSRPGAMKRKDKLERMEKERFGKNMAQMAVLPAVSHSLDSNIPKATQPTTSDRWAALRNFIGQTMEQKPEFRSAPFAKPLS